MSWVAGDAARPHTLTVWAGTGKVATLGYEAPNDRWSLSDDADWIAAPEAFPLSPALPFPASGRGHALGAVKRFVDNLLPEGRALDIAQARRLTRLAVDAAKVKPEWLGSTPLPERDGSRIPPPESGGL